MWCMQDGKWTQMACLDCNASEERRHCLFLIFVLFSVPTACIWLLVQYACCWAFRKKINAIKNDAGLSAALFQSDSEGVRLLATDKLNVPEHRGAYSPRYVESGEGERVGKLWERWQWVRCGVTTLKVAWMYVVRVLQPHRFVRATGCCGKIFCWRSQTLCGSRCVCLSVWRREKKGLFRLCGKISTRYFQLNKRTS